VSDVLDEVLRQAQDLGFFGPGPIVDQRRHAERLCVLALRDTEPAPALRFLDLGSGGGLPGLVLAQQLPSRGRGTLLDSQRRRTEFLAEALARLGLADRIAVVTARAEDAARDPTHREGYDLVVARSFAAPAVTAECAVGFLRAGGRLVVSEPPEPDAARWDHRHLTELGLTTPHLAALEDTHVAILHRTSAPLRARWPRRPGIPQKRPLW
jgi:16S rRNA (guanine527-N7)-methyltransferase